MAGVRLETRPEPVFSREEVLIVAPSSDWKIFRFQLITSLKHSPKSHPIIRGGGGEAEGEEEKEV